MSWSCRGSSFASHFVAAVAAAGEAEAVAGAHEAVLPVADPRRGAANLSLEFRAALVAVYTAVSIDGEFDLQARFAIHAGKAADRPSGHACVVVAGIVAVRGEIVV